MKYHWQQKDWRNFQHETTSIEILLFKFEKCNGRISVILERFPSALHSEAIKTFEIEGEFLSRKDVMSSIKRNLGLQTELPQSKDKKAEGISKLMIAVRNSLMESINCQTIFSWHSMLIKGFKKY